MAPKEELLKTAAVTGACALYAFGGDSPLRPAFPTVVTLVVVQFFSLLRGFVSFPAAKSKSSAAILPVELAQSLEAFQASIADFCSSRTVKAFSWLAFALGCGRLWRLMSARLSLVEVALGAVVVGGWVCAVMHMAFDRMYRTRSDDSKIHNRRGRESHRKREFSDKLVSGSGERVSDSEVDDQFAYDDIFWGACHPEEVVSPLASLLKEEQSWADASEEDAQGEVLQPRQLRVLNDFPLPRPQYQ